MSDLRLGKIISINNDFPVLRVQIEVPDSEEIETATLWNGWGENSSPTVGSFCVVITLNCDFAQKYAFPFNLQDAVSVLSGEKIVFTPNGNKIYLKQDGSLNIEALNDATNPSINISASTAVNININTNIIGDCNVTGVYKVDGVQVVKEQQPAIPSPTGGSIVDTEARTAINSILTAMRTHGLIQT